MRQYQLTFIDLALKRDALRFGNFALKSGRESPYFFNAGLFSDGEALATLGKCYAAAIVHSGIRFDMIFGPAYKGIALAVATVMALSGEHGRSVPCAFNRKEAKDHGEGGNVVGAPLEGRVLVVDDVITAGTAVRESLEIIRTAGAPAPAGCSPLRRSRVPARAPPPLRATPHPSKASPTAGSMSRAWCTTVTTFRRSTPPRNVPSSTVRAWRSDAWRRRSLRSRPLRRRARARRR